MASTRDRGVPEYDGHQMEAQDACQLFGFDTNNNTRLRPQLRSPTTSSDEILEDVGYPFSPMAFDATAFDALEGAEQFRDQANHLWPSSPGKLHRPGLPSAMVDDSVDGTGVVPVEQSTYTIQWDDLSHIGKSVVINELTNEHGSFQKACEALLLLRDDVEKWL